MCPAKHKEFPTPALEHYLVITTPVTIDVISLWLGIQPTDDIYWRFLIFNLKYAGP